MTRAAPPVHAMVSGPDPCKHTKQVAQAHISDPEEVGWRAYRSVHPQILRHAAESGWALPNIVEFLSAHPRARRQAAQQCSSRCSSIGHANSIDYLRNRARWQAVLDGPSSPAARPQPRDGGDAQRLSGWPRRGRPRVSAGSASTSPTKSTPSSCPGGLPQAAPARLQSGRRGAAAPARRSSPWNRSGAKAHSVRFEEGPPTQRGRSAGPRHCPVRGSRTRLPPQPPSSPWGGVCETTGGGGEGGVDSGTGGLRIGAPAANT